MNHMVERWNSGGRSDIYFVMKYRYMPNIAWDKYGKKKKKE